MIGVDSKSVLVDTLLPCYSVFFKMYSFRREFLCFMSLSSFVGDAMAEIGAVPCGAPQFI